MDMWRNALRKVCMLTVRKRISTNFNGDASPNENMCKGRHFPVPRACEMLQNFDFLIVNSQQFLNYNFATKIIDPQLNEEINKMIKAFVTNIN